MKQVKRMGLLALLLVLLLALSACGGTQAGPGNEAWNNAKYTEDTAVGTGEKVITVKVTAGEKSVVLTVSTDQTVLATALKELGIIAGDDSQYGLYITTVNGIVADYNTDKAYWALMTAGEYSMVGADAVEIENGAEYEFVYAH